MLDLLLGGLRRTTRLSLGLEVGLSDLREPRVRADVRGDRATGGKTGPRSWDSQTGAHDGRTSAAETEDKVRAVNPVEEVSGRD